VGLDEPKSTSEKELARDCWFQSSVHRVQDDGCCDRAHGRGVNRGPTCYQRGPDVLNTSGLCVEAGDEDLERVGDVREVGRVRWSHKVLFIGGEVMLKGVRGGLLLLPHEGNLVLAHMGEYMYGFHCGFAPHLTWV
jgi:hypothetical protein